MADALSMFDGLTERARDVLFALAELSGPPPDGRFVNCADLLAHVFRVPVSAIPSLEDALHARYPPPPWSRIPTREDIDALAARALASFRLEEATVDPLLAPADDLYAAIVEMTLPHRTALPLLQGSGHLGTADEDPPADCLYTEVRLAPRATRLLDLDRRGARLPLAFVTGSPPPGIPPFAVASVARACLDLLADPRAEVDLGAPVVPSGSAALSSSSARAFATTGRAEIVLEGAAELSPSGELFVRALPWRESKAAWICALGEAMRRDEVPAIADVWDLTRDDDPPLARIRIDVAPGASPERALATIEERLVRRRAVELRVLVDEREVVLAPRDALLLFVDWRAHQLGSRARLGAELEALAAPAGA